MEIKIIDAEFVAERMVINYTEDGKVRSLIIAPEEIIRYRNAAQPTMRCDGHEGGSFVKDCACQTCGLYSPA